jgi:hypothetical protein
MPDLRPNRAPLGCGLLLAGFVILHRYLCISEICLPQRFCNVTAFAGSGILSIQIQSSFTARVSVWLSGRVRDEFGIIRH